jgi:hypothetical protein
MSGSVSRRSMLAAFASSATAAAWAQALLTPQPRRTSHSGWPVMLSKRNMERWTKRP